MREGGRERGFWGKLQRYPDHVGLVAELQPLVAGAMGARRYKLPQTLSDADSDLDREVVGEKRGRSDGKGVAGPLHDQNAGQRIGAAAAGDLDRGLFVWQWMAGEVSAS